MVISEKQQEKFLAKIRDGKNRQQAAEEVGSTATKFKFLCARDPVFNRAYEDAKREGQGSLVERLERCAVEMAMGGHWPALKFMLTTFGEQYQWARSSKVEIGGTVEVQAVAGILSRFLPSEMYDELMQVIEQRMVEEGEQAALPPAA